MKEGFDRAGGGCLTECNDELKGERSGSEVPSAFILFLRGKRRRNEVLCINVHSEVWAEVGPLWPEGTSK